MSNPIKPPKSFLNQAMAMLGQDTVVSILSFFNNIILARWLGPARLGLFYILALIPSYSEKFGRLGMMDHAAVYYVGQKKYGRAEMVGHLTWIAFVLSLLPVIAFFFLKGKFDVYFLKMALPPIYAWLMVLSIPFIFLTISYNKMMVAFNRVEYYAIVQVIKAISFLGASLFFWWKRWDLFGLCLTVFLTSVLATVLSVVLLRRETPFHFKFNKALVKDLFSYGWKMYVITTLTFLHQRFDLALISLWMTSTDVSYYGMAVAAAQLLWKIPGAVTGVLYARVSSENADKAGELTMRTCRHVLLLLIFSTVGLALFAWPIVRIVYGRAYLPVVMPLWLLLPGVVSMGLGRVLTDHFYGIGRPRIIFIANFVCTGLNIGLNLILIPKYGILGASLISSVTYSLYFIMLIGPFLKVTSMPFSKLFKFDSEDWTRFKALVEKIKRLRKVQHV